MQKHIIELTKINAENQIDINLLTPSEHYKQVYGDSNSYTAMNSIIDDNQKLEINYTFKSKTNDPLAHVLAFYDILTQINFSQKKNWLDFEEISMFKNIENFLKKISENEIEIKIENKNFKKKFWIFLTIFSISKINFPLTNKNLFYSDCGLLPWKFLQKMMKKKTKKIFYTESSLKILTASAKWF